MPRGRQARRPGHRLSAVRELAQSWLDSGEVPDGTGAVGTVDEQDLLKAYAAHLRSLVDLTGGRRLKVVVDAGNGMGGFTAPAVLGDDAGLPALPQDVRPDVPSSSTGRSPTTRRTPWTRRTSSTSSGPSRRGADIGLAFDGDADRCFVIDEKGDPVSPSAVTAMVARREIAKELRAGRSPS